MGQLKKNIYASPKCHHSPTKDFCLKIKLRKSHTLLLGDISAKGYTALLTNYIHFFSLTEAT